MADSVIFEATDDLSESNIGKFFGQPNLVDYVVRGVSSSIDYGNNTVDYTAGEVIVSDSNNRAYLLELDARSGLSLTDAATNHVFVEYDPTTDDAVTFTINTTGSTPTDPNIKIEEVDTSADANTEFNRNPDVGIGSATLTGDVSAGGNDITGVGALDTDQATINNKADYPVQAPQDVASSRSFGTWETNNTGTPLMVWVQASASANGTRVKLAMDTDTSQSGSKYTDEIDITIDSGERVGVKGIIANGNEYRVRAFQDTANFGLQNWFEYQLGQAP